MHIKKSKKGLASACRNKWLGAVIAAALCFTSAHAQTLLLQDNFAGTAGNPPDPSKWTATSGITLTGTNAANFDASGGVQVLDSLPSYTFAPTASLYGQLSTTYTGVSNEIIGFTGSGGNLALRSDLASPDWSMLVGNNYYVTSVSESVSTAGTWVIDWYTNDVQAYFNGTLEFDTAVDAPTGNISGPVTSWVIPTSAKGIEDATYSSGSSGLVLSNVTWQSESLAVPEPSIGALNTFGLGLVVLILYVRNRRLSSDNS